MKTQSTPCVAQLSGLISLLRFEVIDSTVAVWLPDASVELGDRIPSWWHGGAGVSGVRPEWTVASSESKPETAWPATAETVEFSGHYSFVQLAIGRTRLRARANRLPTLQKGDRVWIGLSRPPIYSEMRPTYELTSAVTNTFTN
jgi:TOBE domain